MKDLEIIAAMRIVIDTETFKGSSSSMLHLLLTHETNQIFKEVSHGAK